MDLGQAYHKKLYFSYEEEIRIKLFLSLLTGLE